MTQPKPEGTPPTPTLREALTEARRTLAFCAGGVYGGDDSFSNASLRAAARALPIIDAALAAPPTLRQEQGLIFDDAEHAAALTRANELMGAKTGSPEGAELKALADRIAEYESRPRGSTACPYCGKDYIHQHSLEWLNGPRCPKCQHLFSLHHLNKGLGWTRVAGRCAYGGSLCLCDGDNTVGPPEQGQEALRLAAVAYAEAHGDAMPGTGVEALDATLAALKAAALAYGYAATPPPSEQPATPLSVMGVPVVVDPSLPPDGRELRPAPTVTPPPAQPEVDFEALVESVLRNASLAIEWAIKDDYGFGGSLLSPTAMALNQTHAQIQQALLRLARLGAGKGPAAPAEELEPRFAHTHAETFADAQALFGNAPDKSAFRRGAEDMRELAAVLAGRPYGDEVGAYGRDEPQTVGNKIAIAIRALPPPEEPASPAPPDSAARIKELEEAHAGLVAAMERCGCHSDEHAHYCHEARDRVRALSTTKGADK